MGIGRSEGAPLGAGEALVGEVEGSTGPARAAAELAAAGADSAALAVGLGKLVALGAAEVPGAARSAAWTAVSKICWAIALAAQHVRADRRIGQAGRRPGQHEPGEHVRLERAELLEPGGPAGLAKVPDRG